MHQPGSHIIPLSVLLLIPGVVEFREEVDYQGLEKGLEI